MRAAGGIGRGVEVLRHADPEARMVGADHAVAMGDDAAVVRHIDREDAGAAECLQHRVVELLRAREIGNADREMIDHRIPPQPPPPPIPPMPPPFIRAPRPWRIRPFWPSLETCFSM